MEYVNCNLCHSREARPLFRKKDKFGISEEDFEVVECGQCGLAYINPRPSPEEIGKFYPETYSWRETIESGGTAVARFLKRMEKSYRYHLLYREVSKVESAGARPGSRVLDVGCGTGDRLDMFRRRGFETVGVETSGSADYAAASLHLNVVRGDLLSARFPNDFFDVITLYHVLEHTHDPMKTCKELHRVLRPEGLLVIQVPNRESLQHRLFGKRWAAFDVPRDLYYFGTGALCALLGNVGFKVMSVDHCMNWWHPPTLVISLFPALDPEWAWRKEGDGKSALFQRASWILCTVMAGPFVRFESWMKRGAIVTVYARKKGD